jgi:hypothetical protein
MLTGRHPFIAARGLREVENLAAVLDRNRKL